MFTNRPYLKSFTTLWLTAALLVAGGGSLRACADQCRSAVRIHCQKSRGCCCSKATYKRLCSCSRGDTPSQPASVPVNAGKRLLEWMVVPVDRLSAVADCAIELTKLIGIDRCSIPPSQSVQARFCIWQI